MDLIPTLFALIGGVLGLVTLLHLQSKGAQNRLEQAFRDVGDARPLRLQLQALEDELNQQRRAAQQLEEDVTEYLEKAQKQHAKARSAESRTTRSAGNGSEEPQSIEQQMELARNAMISEF